MADEAVITRYSEKATQDEATADSATTPGHLVERANTDGDYGPHSTDAGATAITPATSAFAGLPFDPTVEKSDSISADERFTVWKVPRGSGVTVDAIASAAISENDYVVSNGDGRVRSAADGEEAAIVGQAVEAAGAADDRIEIEV